MELCLSVPWSRRCCSGNTPDPHGRPCRVPVGPSVAWRKRPVLPAMRTLQRSFFRHVGLAQAGHYPSLQRQIRCAAETSSFPTLEAADSSASASFCRMFMPAFSISSSEASFFAFVRKIHIYTPAQSREAKPILLLRSCRSQRSASAPHASCLAAPYWVRRTSPNPGRDVPP